MKILPRVEGEFSDDLVKRLGNIDPAEIGHYLHFGFMDPRIKSTLENVKVVGQAFTVKTTANDSVMVHKAASLAEQGDVLVIDRAGDNKHACIGEILAYAANVKGLKGIIVDGPCTDIQAIRKIGLPVFSTGLSPITTKLIGNSGEINTTIHCGGVSVHPGDLIIADDNGVLVLPREDVKELEGIIKSTEDDIPKEQKIKQKLDEGESLSAITRADGLLRKKGLIE